MSWTVGVTFVMYMGITFVFHFISGPIYAKWYFRTRINNIITPGLGLGVRVWVGVMVRVRVRVSYLRVGFGRKVWVEFLPDSISVQSELVFIHSILTIDLTTHHPIHYYFHWTLMGFKCELQVMGEDHFQKWLNQFWWDEKAICSSISLRF